jgi:hypothetical protein
MTEARLTLLGLGVALWAILNTPFGAVRAYMQGPGVDVQDGEAIQRWQGTFDMREEGHCDPTAAGGEFFGFNGSCSSTHAAAAYTFIHPLTMISISCSNADCDVGGGPHTTEWTVVKNGTEQSVLQCTSSGIFECSDTDPGLAFAGGDSFSINIDQITGSCQTNSDVMCTVGYTLP